MQEYLMLILKCFIVYFVIIFALRVMGKREVGELSVFDIVIYLVMSELLAISISNADESIMKSLVPIFTLAALQIGISWILLRSKKLRKIFDGDPVILIHNGHINQSEMRKQRYSLEDLLAQIRSCDIASPDEVAFAVLENSGHLSIMPKNKCKVRHPYAIISDGCISERVLKDLHKDKEWLINELKKNGVANIEDVFLCLLQKNGLFVIKKELDSTDEFIQDRIL